MVISVIGRCRTCLAALSAAWFPGIPMYRGIQHKIIIFWWSSVSSLYCLRKSNNNEFQKTQPWIACIADSESEKLKMIFAIYKVPFPVLNGTSHVSWKAKGSLKTLQDTLKSTVAEKHYILTWQRDDYGLLYATWKRWVFRLDLESRPDNWWVLSRSLL